MAASSWSLNGSTRKASNQAIAERGAGRSILKALLSEHICSLTRTSQTVPF